MRRVRREADAIAAFDNVAGANTAQAISG